MWLVSLPKSPKEKEGNICESDGNPSYDNDCAGTFHLDFLTSKTMTEISVIYDLPSQQHFVIAAFINPLKNIIGSSCVASGHLLAYCRSRAIFS